MSGERIAANRHRRRKKGGEEDSLSAGRREPAEPKKKKKKRKTYKVLFRLILSREIGARAAAAAGVLHSHLQADGGQDRTHQLNLDRRQ